MSEFREFWIRPEMPGVQIVGTVEREAQLIHVIEKSAFDSEFKRRTDLSEKCGMMELQYTTLKSQHAELLEQARELRDELLKQTNRYNRINMIRAARDFNKYMKESGEV